MGYYLNPGDSRTKEEFLEQEGKEIFPFLFASKDEIWEHTPQDYAIIVLVDNGAFAAAAIAFSREEFDAFTDIIDSRPKRLFMIKIPKLLGHVPEQVFNVLAQNGRSFPNPEITSKGDQDDTENSA